MTIEADILTVLNNHSGLSALVGQRNYSVNLPQNPVYPNTVNMRVSTNPSNSLTGRNALSNMRVQIDARGLTLDDSTLVFKQIVDAMEKTILFKALYLTSNHIPKESQTETYRISIDFSVWFYDQ